MLITELNDQEILAFLDHVRLGRLACAKDGLPYILPIFFAHQQGFLYAVSTDGKKIEWMRANPFVCVEVDEIESPQRWTSVVMDGHFEELPNTEASKAERELAWSLLQERAVWWEPAYVETIVNSTAKQLHPVYFRVRVTHRSGRRGR